jgi:hypothetical protein
MLTATEMLGDESAGRGGCKRKADAPTGRALFKQLEQTARLGCGCGGKLLPDLPDFSKEMPRRCKCYDNFTPMQTHLLPAGWFSTLHGAVKPLAAATRAGVSLLTPLAFPFTANSVCYQRDLSCFFEHTEIEHYCDAQGKPPEVVSLKSEEFVRNESHSLHGDAIMPTPWRSRGWFWYSSQLLSWIMRPNAKLTGDLNNAMVETGLAAALRRGPVLGVHVRHGDACLAKEQRRMGRVCRSLEAHLARVREYARAHNIRTAYLATDSELVLEEARRNTEFQFLFLPNVARHRETPKVIWDKTVAQRVRKGLNKHNYREAWLATLDAMLLAKTDVLVGQMTSTLFRSAISLRAAKCDCLLPFVSLDAPFCSDYGVKAGRSPDGAFWC